MQSFTILNIQDSELNGIALIPQNIFEALFYGSEDDTRIFGINVICEITDKYVAIKCMPHNEDEDIIFLPDWAREYLGNGTAKINKIDFDLPRAQTIRARVIDNEMYHIDIKEQLEDLLSDFKFIQANIVLTIEIETMGNYPAQIWIEDVVDEDGIPCIGAALLGEEVRLDMCEPLERAPEFEPTEPIVPEVISQEEQRRIAREARLRRFA